MLWKYCLQKVLSIYKTVFSNLKFPNSITIRERERENLSQAMHKHWCKFVITSISRKTCAFLCSPLVFGAGSFSNYIKCTLRSTHYLLQMSRKTELWKSETYGSCLLRREGTYESYKFLSLSQHCKRILWGSQYVLHL